jgi:hypothetical protein
VVLVSTNMFVLSHRRTAALSAAIQLSRSVSLRAQMRNTRGIGLTECTVSHNGRSEPPHSKSRDAPSNMNGRSVSPDTRTPSSVMPVSSTAPRSLPGSRYTRSSDQLPRNRKYPYVFWVVVFECAVTQHKPSLLPRLPRSTLLRHESFLHHCATNRSGRARR